jgi:ATP-dependent Clp protease ATP-binding subunit ClpC
MPLSRRFYVTTRTHQVFELAHDLAESLGHDDVTPAHVAIGLIREGRSIAAQLLSQAVPPDVLERELKAHLPPTGSPRLPPREPSWTPGIEQVLERTIAEARELGTEFFGSEHVLLALLRDETSAPAQVMAHHGVGFEDARTKIMRAYNARPDGSTAGGPSAAV